MRPTGGVGEESPLHHLAAPNGPPACAGEDFAGAAARLGGIAGVLFGWSPDAFWAATPAELAALVAVIAPEQTRPVDAGALRQLMEADGG